MAGQLQNYIANWQRITSDPVILDVVAHCHIEFEDEPLLSSNIARPQCTFSTSEQIIIDNEIEKFLEKGIIEPSIYETCQVISPIFTRVKKDGSHRVIFNLKKLNESVSYHHFKMDTLETALKLMTENCFMTSLDLKNAYYSIPIAKEHQKYLKFVWNNELYAFTCLPMGLSSSPRIFTKLMKPVFATLRSKFGYKCISYIDDSLYFGDTYNECEQVTFTAAQFLTSVGFTIHPEKSAVKPTQIVEYLGFLLNSTKMIVKLTDKKALRIIDVCKQFFSKDTVFTIRQVSSLVGSLVACFPGVEFGQLHYRHIESNKIQALKENSGNFDAQMKLSDYSLADLEWWIQNIATAERKINHGLPAITIFTDASKIGWGAKLENGRSTGGIWSKNESANHINALELLAVKFSLMSLLHERHNTHIRIMSDNTTAVTYINEMGGCKSHQCNEIAKEIWDWARVKNIWLSAAHIPGCNNVGADESSRNFNMELEWMFSKQIFQKILSHFDDLQIDLFASRLNAQLENYVSWKPDPMAKHIDAFCVNWTQYVFYAFPPFCLISRCVQKIVQEQATGVLVIPMWPSQAYFPAVMNLLIDIPLLVKASARNLVHPKLSSPHPLSHNLVLMVCKLSGNPYLSTEFLQKLPMSSCSLGEKVPKSNTMFTSISGCSFVAKGHVIQCIQL